MGCGRETAMPRDALLNGGAPTEVFGRVAKMQAKLHRWAAVDVDRRFDDLFNFVHDPATLIVAFDRVAGNRGANTPGVDGLTVAAVEEPSPVHHPQRAVAAIHGQRGRTVQPGI